MSAAHSELLDTLETRLSHPDFRKMIGGAELVIERSSEACLRLAIPNLSENWLLEATPLDPIDAPDEKPRIQIESARNATKYADHAMDGLVMGVFSMILQARPE